MLKSEPENVPLAELDDRSLILSLNGTICPACGKAKQRAMSLCGGQYRALPATMRKALYARVGQGYREAVIEALTYLQVETAHMPAPVSSLATGN